MIKQLSILIGAVGGVWLLIALLFRAAHGDWLLVYTGVAALTCLLPACLTLLAAGLLMKDHPERAVFAVLGGTGVRMFAVLGVMLYLDHEVPYFREHDGLWAWFLLFYFLTLGLEIALLLSQPRSGHK